jgi:hypothetical protein
LSGKIHAKILGTEISHGKLDLAFVCDTQQQFRDIFADCITCLTQCGCRPPAMMIALLTASAAPSVPKLRAALIYMRVPCRCASGGLGIVSIFARSGSTVSNT